MRMISLVAASFAGAILFSASAVATPQALLVATQGEVPLVCEFGLCTAELSTFCLQPEYENPVSGAPYSVFTGEGARGDMVLVGFAADGSETTVPTASYAITALRGHLAVRVSILEKELARVALAKPVARIEGSVVLAPEGAEPNLSVQLAGLTPVAEGIVAGHRDLVGAARVTRDLIDLMPVKGPTTQADHDAAWEKVMRGRAVGGDDDFSEWTYRRARWGFETCNEYNKFSNAMRYCLGKIHDTIMEEINTDFWDALDYGS